VSELTAYSEAWEGGLTQFDRTLPDLLGEHVRVRGADLALLAQSAYGDLFRRLTYAELAAAVDACARALRDLGVDRGDRVALIFDNRAGVEAMVTLYGVHAAGAINVPVNARFSPTEVAALVEFSGAETVIGAGDVVRRLGDACAGRVVIAAGEPLAGARDWQEWIEQAPPGELGEAPRPDDHADWLFTSGTTGSPKCVMTTHRGCVATGAVLAGTFEVAAGDVLQTPFPFYTSSGCHTSALTALWSGGAYLMEPEVDVEVIARRMEAEGTTVFGAVPAVYVYLLESGFLEPLDLSRVTTIFSGGAPLIPSLVERMESTFAAAEIVNVYGLTEAGNAGLSLRGEEVRTHLGSIGRRGTPWTEMRLVGDGGAEVGVEEVGEICLRGPSIMDGYYRNEEATADALRDGWLFTSDLARRDAEGYIYVFDRRKDVIIRGGFNISSVEVESVLTAHPDVLEAAVVAKPHPSLGEDLRAFVVLAGGAEVGPDELRAHCESVLADFKVPRDIELLPELPRNATGKIQKQELRSRPPRPQS
jgi:acyl-CoA synthetase (AMP-forming)/AMP-acid ligase II